jgi:hypothetical protein
MLVPDDRVVEIEANLINIMNKSFNCIHGQEYFDGDEKDILALLTANMHELYVNVDVSCDKCEIPNTTLKKEPKQQDDVAQLSDIDKEEIKKVLRYDAENDFVIDADDIAKWLSVYKFHVIKTLKKSYKENIDYTIKKSTIKQTQRKYGGNNYKKVMVTPDCFKRMCMRSKSARAKELHTCFISSMSL